MAVNSDGSGRIFTAQPMQWHNQGYQCLAAETSAQAAPYHINMPLSFVSRHLCIWYVGHSRGEANKRSMVASATIGLLSGGR